MLNLSLPSRDHAPATLRALATVALADGALHDQERRMIELVADALGVEVDVDALEPIDPDDLAVEVIDPALRHAFVQRLVILATLDGKITEDEVVEVERFAASLEVDDRAVKNIRQIAEGHVRMVAFDLARRSFMPKLLGKVWRERGVRGFWQLVKALAGGSDAAAAARFEALGELPEGTLGKELHRHFIANAFPYPGQPKSAPDFMLFHDLGHVIGGYGTTPDQELLVAGFQAGYMETDGLVMYLMIAMLFQLAVEPAAKMRGVEARSELVDIDTFLAAVDRGRAMKHSLVDWDPWPHMARPLSEVRAELGVG